MTSNPYDGPNTWLEDWLLVTSTLVDQEQFNALSRLFLAANRTGRVQALTENATPEELDIYDVMG